MEQINYREELLRIAISLTIVGLFTSLGILFVLFKQKMANIINNNVLLREIRRIVRTELQKEIPKNQVNALWAYLNKLDDRIKILERKN